MVIKTRDRLIEVARQLFAHKGVDKTTMNDIANASERGRRTIYTYFRNKKEIYNAVLEAESEQLVTSLREIAVGSGPVDQRLADFLRCRICHIKGQSASTLKNWLMFDTRRLERINRMAADKESALLSDLLAEGCRKGVFNPARCRLFATFIDRMLELLEMPLAAAPKISDARRHEIAESFIEFCVSDLKSDIQPDEN